MIESLREIDLDTQWVLVVNRGEWNEFNNTESTKSLLAYASDRNRLSYADVNALEQLCPAKLISEIHRLLKKAEGSDYVSADLSTTQGEPFDAFINRMNEVRHDTFETGRMRCGCAKDMAHDVVYADDALRRKLSKSEASAADLSDRVSKLERKLKRRKAKLRDRDGLIADLRLAIRQGPSDVR